MGALAGRSRARRALAALLSLVLLETSSSLLGAPRAAADDTAIALAEAAYARGALREANRLFLAALREPGHERTELVRIHLHLGILAGAMGAERTARNHFAIALALDPTLAAPSELAGRDRSRFEQERPAHALSLSVEVVADEAGRALVVRPAHAPPRLVARIEVRCGEEVLPAVPVSRADAAAVRVSLAPSSCAQGVSITALDAHGGALARERRAYEGEAAQ